MDYINILGSFLLFNSTKVAGDIGDVKSMRYLSKETDTQCLKLSYSLNLDPASTAVLE